MADGWLRVLLVVGETDGGIGRHVALLAEQLGGHSVAAAVCGPASALELLGELPGVGREVLTFSPRRVDTVVRARGRLRTLARGFDVVHAHGVQAGAIAAARPRQLPLVVTWHNAPLMTGPKRAAHSFVSRYVARSADLTLGASPDLAALARRLGARDARDTFVVAPPLTAVGRSAEAVRAELGAGARPLVLAVGRLQAQKRFDVLVSAAVRWAGREDAPLVVIAGDGPDRTALDAQIAASRAPVVLLGGRSDVADLLGAADVVALSSAWEARSLVAQEAMRAGVPLVTTAVGGLPDLVGDAALQVPAGDPRALGDALGGLLSDPELRSELATRGLARAGSWPTVEDSIRDLVATYRLAAGHAGLR